MPTCDERLAHDLAAARASAVAACRILLRSTDDAEDCVSQAIEAALAQRAPVAEPKAWLVAVSRRRAVDLIRRRDAEQRAMLSLSYSLPLIYPDAADEILGRHELAWVLRESSGLPAMTRAVIHGVASGDQIGDIATRYGLTKRAAESHLLRARRHLKKLRHRALAGPPFLISLIHRPGPIVLAHSAGVVVAVVALTVAAAPPPPNQLTMRHVTANALSESKSGWRRPAASGASRRRPRSAADYSSPAESGSGTALAPAEDFTLRALPRFTGATSCRTPPRSRANPFPGSGTVRATCPLEDFCVSRPLYTTPS